MGPNRAARSTDPLRAAFPRHLASHVDAVLERLPEAEFEPTKGFSVTLGRERLTIPYRIYFSEAAPALVSGMSDIEAAVLACIYTRHHSGFLRQRMAEQLLAAVPSWAAPFLVQLIGEYVVEILQVMLSRKDVLQGEHFERFAADNPAYIERTKRRIISYWDCYYRREFRRFPDYPGYQLAAALGWWDPRELPNLAPCTWH